MSVALWLPLTIAGFGIVGAGVLMAFDKQSCFRR